jgi:hypothetical protein
MRLIVSSSSSPRSLARGLSSISGIPATLPPLNGPFHRANLLAELLDHVAVVPFRAPGPKDSVLLSVYEQVASNYEQVALNKGMLELATGNHPHEGSLKSGNPPIVVSRQP